MLEIRLRAVLGSFRLDAELEAPGGIVALFGRSGCGKTSLVNAVAGLLTPQSGRVVIDDDVLLDTARGISVPVHRRRIGYVFQDARLFPHLSVGQNLRYGGTKDEAQVIAMLGLAPLLDRKPASLSGGERQRVALGRALMSDPRLLLLDEPLAALDAPRKAEVLPYLERLRDRLAVPMIYVSHDISEVARLATTLAVMQAGRILRAGPVEEMLSEPSLLPILGPRQAGSVLTGRIAERSGRDGLCLIAFSGGELIVPGHSGEVGDTVRMRVPAQDVILSRTRPEGLSALNIWQVRVLRLEPGQGPGVAVQLQAGTDRLLARITKRSVERMGLAPGQTIYAILKATAVAAQDIGEARPEER